jgi:hypothetical protein
MNLAMLFVEARPFAKQRPALMTDAELAALKEHLASYPEAGDAIPGAGGFRKVRWANSQRKKGKRSGSRTIYLHVGLANTIHLLAIYDHEMQDDLTAAERKELAGYAQELKTLARKEHAP